MRVENKYKDILFVTEKPDFYLVANEIVVKKMSGLDISVGIIASSEEELREPTTWYGLASWINLLFTDSFVKNHFLPESGDYQVFLTHFEEMAKMFTGSGREKSDGRRGIFVISFWYIKNRNERYRFLVAQGPTPQIMNSLIAAFRFIQRLTQKKANLSKSALKRAYTQADGIKYLIFEDGEWEVIDPLIEVSTAVSKKYLADNDFRVTKPWIVFQKENLHRHRITSNNWVLTFDRLETLMLQPNDVSIYSNISDQNLVMAEKFYKETILPRHIYFHGNFPLPEQQKEYFDYFQLIITATIFAYTSLEAFANTSIPSRYEFEEEKNGIRTIYSKEAIERTFPLRDKFKLVLYPELKTPDVTVQKWWSKFIELEKLRNEIIHTKQSKSSDRYSLLLSKKIFPLIRVHKDIISFFGKYINMNKPELLEDYPYHFGYDSVVPGLTDDSEYNSWEVQLKNHGAYYRSLEKK